MEKKRYEELELEVVRFDAEDMIATSGGGSVPATPICTPNGLACYANYIVK